MQGKATMQVIIASKNPVKINATVEGFKLAFPEQTIDIEGVSVPSGVSDQPMTDAETLQGAITRAKNAQAHHPQADYWVGLEGGVERRGDSLYCFAWAVVVSNDKQGQGRTATFQLPNEVAQLVYAGDELGDADDKIFGQANSKQKNGSIGILTADRLTRATLYTPGIVIALIPFLNPSLTFSSGV
jgi:inosine/xanthosine triphosphatase